MNALINVHIKCYNYLATGMVNAGRATGAGNASMRLVVAVGGGGGGGWRDIGKLLRAVAISKQAISQSACVMSASESSCPPIILLTMVDMRAALLVRTLLSYVSRCIFVE